MSLCGKILKIKIDVFVLTIKELSFIKIKKHFFKIKTIEA